MKAYSVDLRERVVAALQRGMPRAAVAEQFQVSIPTIVRWVRRQRTTGSLHTSPRPGPPAVKMTALRAKLLPQLEAQPDATLDEHCRRFAAEQGIAVSRATMSRAITRHLGWTFKKSH
jgi:transposase